MGHLLNLVEGAGFYIFDMFTMRFTREHVYEAFAFQNDFPDRKELGEFEEGPCLVVGIASETLEELAQEVNWPPSDLCRLFLVNREKVVNYLHGSLGST